jgi:hypothetical protein
MRTLRTRGSSTVAVTLAALSLIDSDAPRPCSGGTSLALTAAASATLLCMRRDHLWAASDTSYHIICVDRRR